MKYYIDQFGEKTDGRLYTKEIQRAIDECFLAGGGEVIIPPGTYRTGGLRLRSNVTLHLLENTALEGSIDPEDYTTYIEDSIEPIPPEELGKKVSTALPEANGQSVFPYSRWNNAIIRAINAKNIAIIGERGSVIDGQNCFDEQGEEDYRGPHPINFWFCENVTLRGYTIKDGGNWGHAIQNSRDIEVKNVTVLGGHDGLDIRTCDNVMVEDCRFYSGDDAIAGFDNINVTIRNCVLNSACSALRFGGTDVLVENCRTCAPVEYGFRGSLTPEQKRARAATDENCRHNCLNAFLYYCDFRAKIRSTPGNIVIKNCSFKNVDAVFSEPFGFKWACNRALDNIIFEDCIFDGVCESINLDCPEKEPITFTMKNCKVIAREGAEDAPFAEASNFRNITLENVEILGYNNPEIICYTKGEIILTDTSCLNITNVSAEISKERGK